MATALCSFPCHPRFLSWEDHLRCIEWEEFLRKAEYWVNRRLADKAEREARRLRILACWRKATENFSPMPENSHGGGGSVLVMFRTRRKG